VNQVNHGSEYLIENYYMTCVLKIIFNLILEIIYVCVCVCETSHFPRKIIYDFLISNYNKYSEFNNFPHHRFEIYKITTLMHLFSFKTFQQNKNRTPNFLQSLIVDFSIKILLKKSH